MGKYEENFIDRSALFLISSFETERKTKVVTKHGEYYSRLPALQLLDQACMLYASTYDGRVKATRYNLKQHKKTPILISNDGVAAFPTKSPTHPECIWIFNHDYRTEKLAAGKTRIIYEQHNVSVELDVSIHTLEKQRTRMYEMLYYYMKIQDRHNT
ncbi:competence protein ComK [Planococcus shenhongbingii]|uniref:Competence protein ComK n=1 Tax=Planococcus shenhongbingii TaxID=3058398 RepID=A0ABT8NA34_9BACL|nr:MULTISPECIES: competence protein ComK [unclassified Planococcus (in: firmicutes)]MDN7244522.1 competence protein ComK [Planococcus sp. N017]WKA57683.1 competence protein ComK [Planococcus sp. N016]